MVTSNPSMTSYPSSLSFPGCGHCKNLAPAYEQVADAFTGESDVIIAKVDADADRDLGSRFGVSGFPTLKFFEKSTTASE